MYTGSSGCATWRHVTSTAVCLAQPGHSYSVNWMGSNCIGHTCLIHSLRSLCRIACAMPRWRALLHRLCCLPMLAIVLALQLVLTIRQHWSSSQQLTYRLHSSFPARSELQQLCLYLSLSVSVSVTVWSSIKTAKWIGLIFLSLLCSVVRKFRYLQNMSTSIWNGTLSKLWTEKISLSPSHVDRATCCRQCSSVAWLCRSRLQWSTRYACSAAFCLLHVLLS